jgi:8-oxo-dGTP pyrophosphatase MutT (NUDIX family)
VAAQNLGPLCYACARYRGVEPDRGFVCEAYPEGVPVEILASLWNHREPQEGDHGLRFEPMTPIATDPPVSESQRRAMFAAKAGHSTLGIPQKVGEEFANADPGGKLPARAKDLAPEKFGTIKQALGFLKEFFNEEEAEPEHSQDEVPAAGGDPNAGIPAMAGGRTVKRSPVVKPRVVGQDEPKGRAASCAFITSDGRVLLLKRSADEENWPNHWSLPGGRAEDSESPWQTAQRECGEEIGDCSFDGMQEHPVERTPHGWDHTTFVVPSDEFEPRLNDEHSEYVWSHPDDLPQPMHPGVLSTIKGMLGEEPGLDVQDEPFAEVEHSLAHRKGVRDPSALAAYIGREHGAIKGDRKIYRWDRRASDTEHDPHTGQFTSGQHRAAARFHTTKAETHRRVKNHPIAEAHEHAASEHGKAAHALGQGNASELSQNARNATTAARNLEERERTWVRGFPTRFSAQDSRMAMDWRFSSALGVRGETNEMAFDKDSVRSIDDDGRLHVDKANIAKGSVNEYKGSEIPDADALGLDPNRLYRLYRDPVELEKGAKSFAGVPILSKHVPVDSVNHPNELVIGAVGDTDWEDPFITAPLTFWPKKAVDEIESNRKKALSPGYKYVADMTPGVTPEGESYDGRMTQIVGNHLAHVLEGRQGDEVVVGDSKLMNTHPYYSWSSPRFAMDDWSPEAREAAAKARAAHSHGGRATTMASRKAAANPSPEDFAAGNTAYHNVARKHGFTGSVEGLNHNLTHPKTGERLNLRRNEGGDHLYALHDKNGARAVFGANDPQRMDQHIFSSSEQYNPGITQQRAGRAQSMR